MPRKVGAGRLKPSVEPRVDDLAWSKTGQRSVAQDAPIGHQGLSPWPGYVHDPEVTSGRRSSERLIDLREVRSQQRQHATIGTNGDIELVHPEGGHSLEAQKARF